MLVKIIVYPNFNWQSALHIKALLSNTNVIFFDIAKPLSMFETLSNGLVNISLGGTMDIQYGLSFPHIGLVVTEAKYNMIWNNKLKDNVDNSKKSKRDISAYETVVPEGFFSLGSAISPDYNPPSHKTYVVKEFMKGSNALAPPVKYEFIWKDSGSLIRLDGCIWKPIPPKEYIALGFIFRPNYSEPLVSEFACVHESLVVSAQASKLIWNTENSPVKLKVSMWSMESKEMNYFPVGTFAIGPELGRPDNKDLFALNASKIVLL